MKTPTGTRLHLVILALVGLLFIYAGLYKLIYPGQATMALVALDFKPGWANAAIIVVTMGELYLGVLLLLKVDLRCGLWLATGLLFAFTVFLWYLSLLAHPPSCGCMGLTGLFLSNRHHALFGIFRNVVILWLLKFGYDYYVKAPQAVPPGGAINHGRPT